jgi:hypothetical protein
MLVFMISSQGLIDASRDLHFGRADHRARELAIDRNFRFRLYLCAKPYASYSPVSSSDHRPSMLPKSRRVRWLSDSSSQ